MRITFFQEMVLDKIERLIKTTSILKHKEEINRGFNVLNDCSLKLNNINKNQPEAEEQSSYRMK